MEDDEPMGQDLSPVTQFSDRDYGRLNYEMYLKSSDGVSLVSGEPLPTWEKLPERIKNAWSASGGAVAGHAVAQIMRSQGPQPG